ncbi:MAG: hypothetical protein HGGPFJEG_00795 [Ignavibacteria bacterium]|nr:hypothetical protein [Ignavibacteria bacterium]
MLLNFLKNSKLYIFSLILISIFIFDKEALSQTTVNIVFGNNNTLYEDPTGSSSNGAGQYLFTGKTVVNQIRRGLVRFELAEFIPQCAIVTNVSLKMHMSRTISSSTPVQLRKVLKSWGSSNSDPSGEEGFGTSADTGDATWIHTYYTSEYWDRPGGDYSDSISAVKDVDAIGFYTWDATPRMISDVQEWVSYPNSNFGWLLLANESTYPTAKRFDSFNHDSVSYKPTLTVTYVNNSLSLYMQCFLEGFWNGTTMIQDTIKVTLRNPNSPYSIVDEAKRYVSDYGDENFCFYSAVSGTYYLDVNHRNTIETWSRNPVNISDSTGYYYFTDSATKAFGNNQILKLGSYCFYSGDVNQDGIIDGIDFLLVDNSAANFETGYVDPDVNGDEIVDGSDMSITSNNAENFVTSVTP